jgi:hypothetical protein
MVTDYHALHGSNCHDNAIITAGHATDFHRRDLQTKASTRKASHLPNFGMPQVISIYQ